MQRHSHSRANDDSVGKIIGNEIVERFVDTRHVDDDSGNLRHGTYESTQSVARGTLAADTVSVRAWRPS